MVGELHASATDTLQRWSAPTPAQRALAEACLGFLAAREDACRRSCLPGHLTASALILTPDGSATCLVHHGLVHAWLQPGGHLEEGDTSLPAAALREAQEETGLPGLRIDPVPLHIDVHAITCRGSGPTRHFDVRFLAISDQACPTVNEESNAVQWWPTDDLPELFDEVLELVSLGVERVRHAQS